MFKRWYFRQYVRWTSIVLYINLKITTPNFCDLLLELIFFFDSVMYVCYNIIIILHIFQFLKYEYANSIGLSFEMEGQLYHISKVHIRVSLYSPHISKVCAAKTIKEIVIPG